MTWGEMKPPDHYYLVVLEVSYISDLIKWSVRYLILGQTWVLGCISFLVNSSLFVLASRVIVALQEELSGLARCRDLSHLALVHLLQELGPRLLSLLELVLHLLLLLQLHHLLVVVVLLPVLYTVHNLRVKKGFSIHSTNNIPGKRPRWEDCPWLWCAARIFCPPRPGPPSKLPLLFRTPALQ